MKYNAYVGIITHTDAEAHAMLFVTEVDNYTRRARWEAGKPAKALSLTAAKDLCFGLNCNGITAVVVQFPAAFDPPTNP